MKRRQILGKPENLVDGVKEIWSCTLLLKTNRKRWLKSEMPENSNIVSSLGFGGWHLLPSVCRYKNMLVTQLYVILFLCPWNYPGSWSGFPSPGDLCNPGIRLGSAALQPDSLLSEPLGKPINISKCCEILLPSLHIALSFHICIR